ncbi:hypothetical protein C4K68_22955 [Pokkaliibacter plantistimulans]|uniref:Uncharacterized protein n=1 Tax=Proteobacteria bacterium 228 TaxID=2083153 RepID=A0A2S5KJ98_9PROT|nr:hypothetical protein [Pokkaliibacter plantistimulans]PPC74858.1 hypothetical protein C4K68_22955 [Pokkaliibacter plantistimulans]
MADSGPSLCEHTALTTDCCAHGLIALPIRWHAAHLPLDSPLRPQPLDDARSLILPVPQRPPTVLS